MKKVNPIEILIVCMLAAPVAFYAFVPSSVFLDVKGVWVKGDRAYINRDTPFGPVAARWQQEIVTPGGLTCPQEGTSSGKSIYEVRNAQEPFPNFQLGEWAEDCLVEDAIFRTKHNVVLFGVFELRAVTTQGPVRLERETTNTGE